MRAIAITSIRELWNKLRYHSVWLSYTCNMTCMASPFPATLHYSNLTNSISLISNEFFMYDLKPVMFFCCLFRWAGWENALKAISVLRNKHDSSGRSMSRVDSHCKWQWNELGSQIKKYWHSNHLHLPEWEPAPFYHCDWRSNDISTSSYIILLCLCSLHLMTLQPTSCDWIIWVITVQWDHVLRALFRDDKMWSSIWSSKRLTDWSTFLLFLWRQFTISVV